MPTTPWKPGRSATHWISIWYMAMAVSRITDTPSRKRSRTFFLPRWRTTVSPAGAKVWRKFEASVYLNSSPPRKCNCNSGKAINSPRAFVKLVRRESISALSEQNRDFSSRMSSEELIRVLPILLWPLNCGYTSY